MRVKYFVGILILSFFQFSCDDILEVDDISNQEVQILAPKEGAMIGSNTVNFNWDELGSAEAYRIQIAQPNFENASQILMDSTMVKDTLGRVITSIQKRLLNGNYQWRIRASNSGFQTAYATFGFTVNGDVNADIIPPNTPQLVSPTNEATQDDTTVSFSWTREDVPGTAERDSIYIYQDESLETLETRALGSNKEFIRTLSSNQTYFWRVKAFDASNESDFSTVFKISIN
tara:strand:- start:3898 stop:4590 length:693 start_codon:yes stop_codon:yes gene_type:complete